MGAVWCVVRVVYVGCTCGVEVVCGGNARVSDGAPARGICKQRMRMCKCTAHREAPSEGREGHPQQEQAADPKADGMRHTEQQL